MHPFIVIQPGWGLGELGTLTVSDIDVERADYDGRTVKHLAAQAGRAGVLRALIDVDTHLGRATRSLRHRPFDDAK